MRSRSDPALTLRAPSEPMPSTTAPRPGTWPWRRENSRQVASQIAETVACARSEYSAAAFDAEISPRR